ncbi:hypothetical protein JHD47_03640 [Sulfurimonas sp. SAG-AH-194-L11]|nr:hypothetical protein [Sulfurimonas sp. SAG-AH-194-L11]MDF1876904.1 hypothetical protein [Sulfurimonas sp. SAG-AH-194-L11]
MKTFLIINILLLLLSACSYDNAFSRFDISAQRAKSEESIISSKIYDKTDTIGVVSCVYLNAINPQKYKDGEYFYIYLYAKDTKAQVSFTLNGVDAILVEELEVDNKFILLTDSNVTWQKYYFVKFAQQATDLTLVAKIAHFSSDAILFKKDD